MLVFGNETLLFTAINNVVINACKYSDNHEAVVSLKAADKEVSVFVKDTGQGIDSSEIDKIFQPFYRIVDTRTEGGFGLEVSLDVSLPGVPKAEAEALVAKAHQVCPYSNATRNNIDVKLAVV